MRDVLEKLLRTAEVPSPERTQQRWDEYRYGASSSDVKVKASADAAFASLLAWYGGPLYRHVWGFIRSDEADDVFQDVLRKLHEKRLSPRLHSFHANVLPWLRTVAIRQCVDAHRSASRRRIRESRAALHGNEYFSTSGQDELREVLVTALARLPGKLRQAVALHYFEGLDLQSAAVELGIHRDTLRVRLTAALKRLRSIVSTPLAIGLASEITLSAALSCPPPLPSTARLSELATGAWASAGLSARAGRRLLVLATTGLILAAGAVPLAALIREDRLAPSVQALRHNGDVERDRPETLQEMNVRLVRKEVAPLLLKASQTLVPADNPLHLVDVRAFGSEVECEFRTEQPVLPGWKPSILKVRFCTLMRKLDITVDLDGKGSWKPIDPERPIILDLAIPGVPLPAVDMAKEHVKAAQAAFERLPRDERAETEEARWLFESDREVLCLPPGLRGFTADAGSLYVVVDSQGLYVRDRTGGWRFGGKCPGWWLVAHGGQLYCLHNDHVLIRPAAATEAPWTPWCPFPALQPGEKTGFLAASGNQLFAMIHPNVVCSRSLLESQMWKREVRTSPIWPDGVAGSAELLFAHDDRHLLKRTSTKPDEAWIPVTTWPQHCAFLAVDGDRLLSCGGPGPILARPVAAGPNADWETVGQVRVPSTK